MRQLSVSSYFKLWNTSEIEDHFHCDLQQIQWNLIAKASENTSVTKFSDTNWPQSLIYQGTD